MPPKAPRESTVRRLFALSINRCAFPGCATGLIDADSNTVVAEVCHIRAQRENGPRYDTAQDGEERHGFDNLVLMCAVHHKVIDAPENLHVYTTEYLMELKQRHEQGARASGISLPELTDQLVAALQDTAVHYQDSAVHMDFTNATFRVGGEGGGFGGGGGGGGVLTIVGTTRVPPEAQIELGGGGGKGPGGGGGGGGAIEFVGRPADTDDLANGLRISSAFLANAASKNGVFNVLGGGWSYIPIPSLPFRVRLNLVAVVEFGVVAPETLIRLDVHVLNPQGTMATTAPVDVSAPTGQDLTPRSIVTVAIDLDLTAFGRWNIRILSSHIELATYPFECRLGPVL